MIKNDKFVVTLTADFFGPSGSTTYEDIGLSAFSDQPKIRQATLSEHRPTIGSDQVKGTHGVIVMTPQVTAETVAQADELLAIGRFGVGYDSVDIEACTVSDVLVYITTGAVDYSVAEATLGWMLALNHHVRAKDELVRTGRWNERSKLMGTELRERTFGMIGFGGIARALVPLLRPFGMKRLLAFDPYVESSFAAANGVDLVPFETLMRESDFVSVHCPLTEQTRGMIGRTELSWMRPSAYLLNTARGGIVDEDALYAALDGKRIAGAAIDCFVGEPIVTPHRFAKFDSVLLSPHSIAWTKELFRDIGRMACQGMVDLAHGKRPRGIVNPEVLDRPGFKAKWERILMNIG